MDPNDMLLLTITAALAAFKFGLIVFAAAMLIRGILQTQGKLSPHPIPPVQGPYGSRGSRGLRQRP